MSSTCGLQAARLAISTQSSGALLGQGFAILVPQNGNAAMVVLPNDGVKLSGLLFDAGPVNSPVLLSVGHRGPGFGSASDPDVIQDVYFRIGGAGTTNVGATVSLRDNAENSVIGNVWAWRADHGNQVGCGGGTDVFYQNELPYDPPTQSAWTARPGWLSR